MQDLQKIEKRWRKQWNLSEIKQEKDSFFYIPWGVYKPYEYRDDKTFVVVWVGYSTNSSQGILIGTTNWHQADNVNINGLEWQNISDRVVKWVHSRNSIRALPINGLTTEIGSTLTNQLRNEFLCKLPDHVQQAFSRSIIVESQTYLEAFIGHDAFLRNRCLSELMLLNILLGYNPTNGYSIEDASYRRAQFLNVHPILGANYLLNRKNPVKSIDNGDASIPLLKKSTGYSENTVKLLMNAEPVFGQLITTLMPCVQFDDFFSGIQVQDHPEVRQIDATAALFFKRLFELLPNRKLPCNNLGKTLDVKHINHYYKEYNNLNHLNDTARAMATELFLPCTALKYSVASITPYLLKTALNTLLYSGLDRMIAATNRHLSGNIHTAHFGMKAQDGNEWVKLEEDRISAEGLVLRFLTSQKELDWEGSKMRHCVASYGMDCKKKYCAILSIGEWKDDTWVPSSTAEIITSLHDNHVTPRIAQHLGIGNGPPPIQNERALSWWILEHKNKTFKIQHLGDRKEKSYWDADETDEDDLPMILGEGWKSPEAMQYRWDRWRRILNVKSRSFSDWLLSLNSDFLADQRHQGFVEDVVDAEELLKIEIEIKKLDVDLDVEENREQFGFNR